MLDNLVLILGLGSISVASAIGGLFLLAMLSNWFPQPSRASIFREGADATVFLFDGEDLVDATPSAYRLLTGSAQSDKPWTALLARLSARFDNLEAKLSEVEAQGSISLQGRPREGAQPVSLSAEMRGGLLKITLLKPGSTIRSHQGDMLTVHALDTELNELRDATNAAPFPIWRTLKDGEIVWTNEAYMQLLARVPTTEAAPDWPFRPLFDLTPRKSDAKGSPLRRTDPLQERWYDVTVRPLSDGMMCYALPAEAAVAAEGALFDFKQTLTNTFAELSTGLAVFDHHRKLQLFNPALVRLIELPVEFFLKRPALFSMLDAMRDRNMLPEPKDYKSWRHQMVALEATSVKGEYKETWHLPNGKAFRVVGRPYPNGALALMVDDITDQVTRDRLFRGELEQTLAVLNLMDDAILVLSAVGAPLATNLSYRNLWGHDPMANGGRGGAMALLDLWRQQTQPSLFWTSVEAALNGEDPIPHPQTVVLNDGTQVHCRVMPLPEGATCLVFRQETTVGDRRDLQAETAVSMALTA